MTARRCKPSCPSCRAAVIVRDWYDVIAARIDRGACTACGTPIPGRYGEAVGSFGRRRMRVVIGADPTA